MHWTKLLERAKTLPPGHVDRRKAEKMRDKEYELCFALERKWRKRINHSFKTEQEVFEFCNRICEKVGNRKLRKMVSNSPDVHSQAAAHYCNGEIHFRSNYFPLSIVIHELSHHCGPHTHCEKFCDIENLLFLVAYTELTGKQPKSDW